MVRVFFALLVVDSEGGESGVSGLGRFLLAGFAGEEVRSIGAERFFDGAAADFFAVSRCGRDALGRMNPGIWIESTD